MVNRPKKIRNIFPVDFFKLIYSTALVLEKCPPVKLKGLLMLFGGINNNSTTMQIPALLGWFSGKTEVGQNFVFNVNKKDLLARHFLIITGQPKRIFYLLNKKGRVFKKNHKKLDPKFICFCFNCLFASFLRHLI